MTHNEVKVAVEIERRTADQTTHNIATIAVAGQRTVSDTEGYCTHVISDATAEAPNGSCETVNRAEPKTRDANAVNENLQQRVADGLAKLRSNR